MIITLICVGLLILGIVGCVLSKRTNIAISNFVGGIIIFSLILGIIGTLVCTVGITSAHVGVSLKQETLDMEYKVLLDEVSYIKGAQDEPVPNMVKFGYATVADHVLEWNKTALNYQKYGNSPWTNWFYNNAERSMKLIDF